MTMPIKPGDMVRVIDPGNFPLQAERLYMITMVTEHGFVLEHSIIVAWRQLRYRKITLRLLV